MVNRAQANRRKIDLDALEHRLTGPQRIGLFGHRNVGKTTLLAMFYRQASAGQVPGLRLAAGDPASAEYLAEKIAQIESGEPPAGTLAETELRLRLYHRRGAVRPDRQGLPGRARHARLRRADPGVLRRLRRRSALPRPRGLGRARRAPAAAAGGGKPLRALPRPLRRRHHRPARRAALDQVRPRAGQLGPRRRPRTRTTASWGVERLVEARYGMTRHALAQHAPRGAIFAVSALWPGGQRRPAAGRAPPARPGGAAGLARRAARRPATANSSNGSGTWLPTTCPGWRDASRLRAALSAVGRARPTFRERLKSAAAAASRRAAVRIGGRRRRLLAAGPGRLGFLVAITTPWPSSGDNPAPAVARRWGDCSPGTRRSGCSGPASARLARQKQAEWTVKAAAVQVANGTAAPELAERLVSLKDEAPQLVPAIRKVEVAQEQARHDRRWNEVRGQALAPTDEPEKPLAEVQAFLREFPDTPHRSEALALAESLRSRRPPGSRPSRRQIIDDLIRSEGLPNADFRDLIERARQFLADHPQSDLARRGRAPARGVRPAGSTTATSTAPATTPGSTRTTSPPGSSATRTTSRRTRAGGRYISEATEAKDRILREWDTYTYRQAYDHLVAHPDDVAEVARRLRDYLRVHPDGRYARDAQAYLDWWDKVSVPGDYRVTLRRGEVDPDAGKYLGGGGPDLGVVLEVAGAVYGPSPVIRNTHRPIWDYTFPRPIRWKLGDPVTIRIIDYDWSDSPSPSSTAARATPWPSATSRGPSSPPRGARRPWCSPPTSRCPSESGRSSLAGSSAWERQQRAGAAGAIRLRAGGLRQLSFLGQGLRRAGSVAGMPARVASRAAGGLPAVRRAAPGRGRGRGERVVRAPAGKWARALDDRRCRLVRKRRSRAARGAGVPRLVPQPARLPQVGV